LIIRRNHRYYTTVEDERLVKQAVDTGRVKAGRKGAIQMLQLPTSGNTQLYDGLGSYIPVQARRVLRMAEKLVKDGEDKRALGLIEHTLIGARETGSWVIWVGDYFIYHEEKAKPSFHYFRSERLAQILENMGFKQGFIHTEPVEDLIYNMFPGGFREARRIHYLLKNNGWFQYGPPLLLYIAIYFDGTGGFRLNDVTTGKTVVEVNYDPHEATQIHKHIVTPEEHVDRNNDKPYSKYG